jgi:hypothetical protein
MIILPTECQAVLLFVSPVSYLSLAAALLASITTAAEEG